MKLNKMNFSFFIMLIFYYLDLIKVCYEFNSLACQYNVENFSSSSWFSLPKTSLISLSASQYSKCDDVWFSFLLHRRHKGEFFTPIFARCLLRRSYPVHFRKFTTLYKSLILYTTVRRNAILHKPLTEANSFEDPWQ